MTSKRSCTAWRRPSSRIAPLPVEARAEDTHAVQLAVRGECPDDAGTGIAVPAEVAAGVRLDVEPAVLVTLHRDRRLHRSDARMGIDAAVDHAHPDAGAGGAAERPLARHALRPIALHVRPGERRGRQAPGRQFLACLLRVNHAGRVYPPLAGANGGEEYSRGACRECTIVPPTWRRRPCSATPRSVPESRRSPTTSRTPGRQGDCSRRKWIFVGLGQPWRAARLVE